MNQTEQKTEIEKKLEHFEARIPIILLLIALVSVVILIFIGVSISLAINFPISIDDNNIIRVISFGIDNSNGIVFFIPIFSVLAGAWGYFRIGCKTEKIAINSRKSLIIAVAVIAVLILLTELATLVAILLFLPILMFPLLLFSVKLFIFIALTTIMDGTLGRVLGRAMGGILGGVIGGLLGGLIGLVMSSILGILMEGYVFILYILLPIGLNLLVLSICGLNLIILRIIRFGTSGLIGRNTEKQEQLGARLGACFAMASYCAYIVYFSILFYINVMLSL